MKTRKVGRVLSVLLAIAMVVGLMIPASSVLADVIDDGTYRNTPKSITTLDELHDYINRASNAEIYSAERPILLRLDADIEIPLFYGTRIGANKDSKRYLGYAAGDFRVNGVAASYDNTVITIPDGAYVSIDLNGHSIKMSDAYKTRGKGLDGNIPNPEDTSKSWTRSTRAFATFPQGGAFDGNQMASVFTVKGFLTIKDTSTAQTGSISGGTGNVLDKLANGNMDTRTDSNGNSVYFFKTIDGLYVTNADGKTTARDNLQTRTISGGGILVTGSNAVLNLEGGNIHDNFVWVGEQYELITPTNESPSRYAKGGGIAVENGATFNMSGGKIYHNVCRAYNTDADGTHAFGGGVYVGSNAVMNFTGGVIANNSTYARQNANGSDNNIPMSEGGGVYVDAGGVFNMYGPDNVQDMSDLDAFPTIANNTVGLYSSGGYAYAEGAGLYVAGYANLRHAVVTGNSFARFTSSDYKKESNFVIETVVRDSETGKVIYANPNDPTETVNPVTGKEYEAGDTVNGARVVPQTATNTSTNDTWLYAIYSGDSSGKCSTNGAGISVDSKVSGTTLNIGEQVWVYDNWDLVSTKFNTRNISQDDVYLTRSNVNGKAKDAFISLAAPAHESKIGINVVGGQKDRIVGVKAVLPNSGTQAKQFASFVKVFGDYYGNYTPQQTDVQFFWDNGSNAGATNNPAPDYPVIFSPTATTVNSGISGAEQTTPTYLLFGNKADAYENAQYKGYVLRNYNEADIHYYATPDYSGTVKTITWQESRNTTPLLFEAGDTIPFVAPLERPNYDLYKFGWTGGTLKNKSGNSIATAGESSVAYNATTGIEQTDLYFKGWEFYAPYGHRTIPYLNFINAKTKGDANYDANDPDVFTHRFTSDDLLKWNPNELHQTVPSYTAMWYSKTELDAARHDLSITKGALLIGEDNKVYIRVAALLGGYMADSENLQPTNHTAADGTELYFNKPTFVASYTNATPTLEGGYKTTDKNGTPFEARVAKKLVCNATNKKVTLDTWNYVPGNNSAFANDAWTLWNTGKNHHNKNGDSTFLGIMWVDIDTGITYNPDTNELVGDTSKVIYVTPCIEVTDRSGSTHYNYYYGESRAYSVAQLLAADGGLNK